MDTIKLNFPENEPLFPISTAAKLLNISVPTLRLYEKEGLILPQKSENNQRLYSYNDLKRVECIRKSINVDKISISGIKTILSLIPCWEIVNCTKTPGTCAAYKEIHAPCWLLKNNSSSCSEKDCRKCEVYLGFDNCEGIKKKIVNLSTKKIDAKKITTSFI